MLILKIIGLLTGLMFTTFGYLIRFKKKYHLINGFEHAFKAGRRTEDYAIKVGTIEFVIGIVILIITGSLIVFK